MTDTKSPGWRELAILAVFGTFVAGFLGAGPFKTLSVFGPDKADQKKAPPCPGPGPCPVPAPEPPAPKKPWGPREYAPVGASRGSRFFVQSFEDAKVGGGLAPDGKTEIQCDLPTKFHIKNRGGSDGAGLCVFASLTHASIWQHVRPTENLFQWMWKYPGGGYPQKVDAKIEQISREQNVPPPDYVQVQSRDLEVLKLACRTRRMPSVTYGYSPTGRYGGSKIAHMVSLAHADDQWFGVLDNNFPGTIEWMDPQTFVRVYTSGSSNGWAVVLLNAPPPRAPRNLKG